MNDPLRDADPEDLRNVVLELKRRIEQLEQSFVSAGSADELVQEMGNLDRRVYDSNGVLRYVVSTQDLYDEFEVHAYQIAFDEGGNITWYTSSETGETVFIGGGASLGVNGLFVQGIVYAIQQLMDDGAGNVRIGTVGARLLEGEVIPSFGMEYEQPSAASELVLNGEFPTDIANWTVDDENEGVWEWVSSLGGKGGVAGFRYTNAATPPSGAFSQAVDVTPDVQYQFSLDLYLRAATGTVKLYWYDGSGGSGNLIRTDTVWNGAYSIYGWYKKSLAVLAPPDAASVNIVISFTSGHSGSGLLNQYYIAIDNVSLRSGADVISNYLMFHPDTARLSTRAEDGYLASLAFAFANLTGIPAAGVSLSGGGSLTVGQAYYYKLTYYDASGETIASDASSVVTPTVGNQTALVRAFVFGQFKSVPRIPGAIGFNVYRSTDAVNYYYLASVASPTQSYSDNGSVAVDTNRPAPTTNTTSSQPFYPKRATIWGMDAESNTTVSVIVNAAQLFNHYSNVSAANANDGDIRTTSFFLAAGEYEFETLGLTVSNCGKVDYYIDGVLVASGQDWYSAVTSENEIKTFTTIIQKGGYHRLEIRVNGKHASSTDYRFLWTRIHIHPRYED